MLIQFGYGFETGLWWWLYPSVDWVLRVGVDDIGWVGWFGDTVVVWNTHYVV